MAGRRRSRRKAAAEGSYHHGSLREALIERGGEIIEKAGIPALTLRSVAEAAGVSRQAPYHHFGDKEGLLAAIALDGFEKLAETMKVESAKHERPEDRLVGLGTIYVRFSREFPGRFELGSSTFTEENRPELLQAREAARAVLEEAVSELLGPDASKRQIAAATAGCWALAHGIARLLGERGLSPGGQGLPGERDLVRETLRTFVVGLEARRQ